MLFDRFCATLRAAKAVSIGAGAPVSFLSSSPAGTLQYHTKEGDDDAHLIDGIGFLTDRSTLIRPGDVNSACDNVRARQF